MLMVGETGFEPATPWSQTRCATSLRHSPTPAPLERGAAGGKHSLSRSGARLVATRAGLGNARLD